VGDTLGVVVMTADVSTRLLEVDFSGIEAVLTGWYLWRHLSDVLSAGQYIRLAQLGIHAAVAAIAVGKPANLTWPDDRLGAYLREIKEAHPTIYDRCKRTVHGSNYGLTPYGACEQFPEAFPTLKDADRFFQFYHTLCPALPTWHHVVRQRGRDHGYLGGITLPPASPSVWDHPYGYRHWFWEILSYKPVDEVTARKWLMDAKRTQRIVRLHGRYFRVDYGADSKRAVAFFPQSTAAAILKLAELRLFHPDSTDFVGDALFGRTPLLHPVHDSLLMMVPNRIYDRVLAICVRVMQDALRALPIPPEWGMGRYLRIGVAAKGGRTWDSRDMHQLPVTPIRYGVEHPEDAAVIAAQESDEEMWNALSRRVA
jgi:hypothetical protein